MLSRGFGCKIQTKRPFKKRWHGFGLQMVYNYPPKWRWLASNYSPKWRWIDQDIHLAANAARCISWAFTDTEVNNNVSIYPTSESVRNRPFKKIKIIKKQSRALSRSLISEYPGYSLISEPITTREKHYSLVGYMLTVDIYRAAKRRDKYPPLVTDTNRDNCLSICQISE